MTKANRLLGILGVSAMIVVLTSPAFAVCNPGKNMGQLSFDLGFQETRFPGANNDAYSGLIVGKFWQAGAFATANSGTYPASGPVNDAGNLNATWVVPSDVIGIDPNLHGNMTWGYWGDANTIGCAAGNLITIVQSPNLNGNGSSTVVARVAEVSGPFLDWDYCKTSATGWDGKQIPKPAVHSVKVSTGVFNLTVDPPDVSSLFYGEPGMDPSATITGRRLYRFVGLGALGNTRPATRAQWTDTGLVAAGAAGGTALALPQLDCTTLGAGNDLFLAWALVLDNGAYQSDLLGEYTQVVCNSGLAQPGKFKNIDKRQGPKTKVEIQ